MRTRRSQSSSDPVTSGSHRAPAQTGGHTTVLLHEAVDALSVHKSSAVLDATLGVAGHAQQIAEQLGPDGLFIGFDLDSDAISRAEVALQGVAARTLLINANFRHLKAELRKRGVDSIDAALFDLGWSGTQLDAGRGFSFQTDEPLLMTYAKVPTGFTASEIVNRWQESSLADVIFGWGEERHARRIARAIVEAREKQPIKTARELAEIVKGAVPAPVRYSRLHPATKTFQALRIAVNDELGALQEGLEGARELLTPGGKIAVITFHSIEDRVAKRLFAGWEKDELGMRTTKKPLTPSFEEIKANPRARSAKLRVFQKISNT